MYQLVDGALDRGAIEAAVTTPEHGAVLVFVGVTRDHFEGRRVVRLSYEAWDEGAITEMRRIGSEIEQRWPGARVAMAHRIGDVPPGEASVVIAVGTAHRAACYEASRYGIEQLKARVPIWKKELYEDGASWKENLPS